MRCVAPNTPRLHQTVTNRHSQDGISSLRVHVPTDIAAGHQIGGFDDTQPDMCIQHYLGASSVRVPAADLDFIAHVRQDIPRLVAEIRRPVPSAPRPPAEGGQRARQLKPATSGLSRRSLGRAAVFALLSSGLHCSPRISHRPDFLPFFLPRTRSAAPLETRKSFHNRTSSSILRNSRTELPKLTVRVRFPSPAPRFCWSIGLFEWLFHWVVGFSAQR